MPWITVVKGKSFTVKTDDGYELRAQIESHQKFKDIESDLNKNNLFSIFITNSDDDELVLSVGKEFHDDRHIFQGLTVTLDDSFSAQDQAAVQSISEQIEAVYTEMGIEFEVKEGLLVGQFD
jgi:hypothetical protein